MKLYLILPFYPLLSSSLLMPPPLNISHIFSFSCAFSPSPFSLHPFLFGFLNALLLTAIFLVAFSASTLFLLFYFFLPSLFCTQQYPKKNTCLRPSAGSIKPGINLKSLSLMVFRQNVTTGSYFPIPGPQLMPLF